MTMYIFIKGTESTPNSLALFVKDLEHKEIEYDEIELTVNGETKTIPKLNSQGYDSGTVSFEGLATHKGYEATGRVKFQGVWQDAHGATFVVQEEVPEYSPTNIFPSGTLVKEYVPSEDVGTMEVMPLSTTDYLPTYYPRWQQQWIWVDENWAGQAGSCVANALSCIKEIHHHRKTGFVEYFSSYWLYGNRLASEFQGEGMYVAQALRAMRDDGALRTIDYTDNFHYQDFSANGKAYQGAKNRVKAIYANSVSSSRKNKVQNGYSEAYYTNINIGTLQNSIVNDGGIIVSIQIWEEFYTIPSTGIVPAFTSFNGVDHSMAIIGWKTINGVLHWICKNSWGPNWGESGICYLPTNHRSITWYNWNIKDVLTVPDAPPNLNILQQSNDNTKLRAYWSLHKNVTSFNVYYRLKGSSQWTFSQSISGTVSSATITSLTPLTTYEVKVVAVNQYGEGEPSIQEASTWGLKINNFQAIALRSQPGVINVQWDIDSYAHSYNLELFRGETTDVTARIALFTGLAKTTTTHVFSGLTEDVYTVKLVSKRNNTVVGQEFSAPAVRIVELKENVPPVVTITRYPTLRSRGMFLTYTATDIGGSGVKDYFVAIGSKNGDIDTMVGKYTTQTTSGWSHDGDGLYLSTGAYYWIGVRARDNDGNESEMESMRIQYAGEISIIDK